MTSEGLNPVSEDVTPIMPQTAANTFFHNPDLCTLLTQTLLSINTAHTIKPCQTPSPTNPPLPFRGITHSTYNAVMSEHPARLALGLDPQDESASGVLMLLDPKGEGKLVLQISHSDAYISTLLAREVEEEKEELEKTTPPSQHPIDARRRQRHQNRHLETPQIARIFTHHPAAAHQHEHVPKNLSSLPGTPLSITAEAFSSCSHLPLARETYLTQPPQKRIAFGVRYEYCPGPRQYFTLHNEAGIRFGDLVEFFERKPGMVKQPVDPEGSLGRYRRWLRDGEFVWMNLVEWQVERGVVREGGLWRRARARGESEREAGGG